MSTHLPSRIASRASHRQCLFQHQHQRTFTTTPARFAQPFKRRTGPRAPPIEKSPSVMLAESMKDAASKVNDIGVLPRTFVRSWAATPGLVPENLGVWKGEGGWRESLGRRWRYESMWFKTRFSDFWGMHWSYKRRAKKTKIPLRNRESKNNAMTLYRKLNEQIASKDGRELRQYVLDGLVGDLRRRWAARPADMTMRWELLSTPSLFATRIVSNRWAPLPFPGAENPYSPSNIRQMVVRLHSRQRITIERALETPESEKRASVTSTLPWAPAGADAPAFAEAEAEVENSAEQTIEKDVVEYVLMQSKMVNGEQEPWKIWGFVEPTTYEKMVEDEQLALEQSEKAVEKENLVGLEEGKGAAVA